MDTISIENDILSGYQNTDLRTDVPYDFESLRNEHAFEKAENENLDIVFPKDDELQIDIDNEHSFRLFNNQMVILSRYIAVLHIQVRPSRNGLPGRHITVRLERAITPLERIALQAMLGSDRIRELLGFIRLNRNEAHPTLFFERKS